MRACVDTQIVRRSGVTLLELIVVIAVIGLLASLALPAVQSARDSARNIECRSHLRQLGIALHSYEATWKVLPTVSSTYVRLLPHIEQTAMIKALRTHAWSELSPDVRLFICPSDPHAVTARYHTNYLINEGSGAPFYKESGLKNDYRGHYFRISEISDGTSNTALMAEQLVPRHLFSDRSPGFFTDQLAAEYPRRSLWYVPSMSSAANPDINAFVDECRRNRFTAVPVRPRSGPFPWLSVSPNLAYNHVLGPNEIGCYNGPPSAPGGQDVFRVAWAAAPPTSQHRGGVNLLLADGSVRFIADGVDLDAWRALGTKAHGESNSL